MAQDARLPEEVMSLLNDPKSIKVVATRDEEGVPHVVFKGSLRAVDDKTIGFVELIDGSRTMRNILKLMNLDIGKKIISVNVLNPENGVSYQIKGEPVRLEVIWPPWDEFLDMIWKWDREANPVGVWLIKVREVLNQTYKVRLEEEDQRLIPSTAQWSRFLGARE